MFEKKRLLTTVLVLSAAVILAGCGKKGGTPVSAEKAEKPDESQTVADLKPDEADMTEWEKSSGIWDWEETEEELYEKAKAEGAVTLYSISSRSAKVAEDFNAKYPGVVCTPFDISTNELLEKVTREHEAGVYNADVVHIKDVDGSLWMEYVREKLFYAYQPSDIMAHIDKTFSATSTPLYIELIQLFYNSEANPDGAPVSSLWDLTKPEWTGRVLMQNPVNDLGWSAWATGFVLEETATALEAEYEEVFGEPLTLSSGCENAGYEFLKRLYDNAPVFTSSSDEAAEAVGTRGQANPPIGFAASSKVRKNEDSDWVLAPVNLTPNTGIPAINTLYAVEGAKHSSAAKLLIRFMMGGTDGTETGYSHFNTLGGWPVRDDIVAAEGSTPYSEVNVAEFDPLQIYETIGDVTDFWIGLGS